MSAGGIAIDHLTVAYDRQVAVRDIDGWFESGSMTAIVGPNGAGKSTLIKTIVGLLRPAHGGIVRPDRSAIAYLPQAAEIDRSFPITAGDLVTLGAWGRTGAFGRVAPAVLGQADDALRAVGLDGLAGRSIGTLSVGQFQRVLFARLLLQDAPVIVLDEPFAAIDARTTGDLIDLVRRWHGERRTVIAVLHDLEQVRTHFPRSLLLARNQIAWGPTAEALSPANLARARALAEGWDDARAA